MASRSENQTLPEWIFDVLSDVRKFAKVNNLTDLAFDLQIIEKKYLENYATSNRVVSD